MVFSNPVFLFLFLPATLAFYFVSPRFLKNTVLLGASLFFYAWGEDLYVLLLLGSIVLNYLLGIMIDVSQGHFRKWMLWLGIAANLVFLGYYKYIGFIFENLGVIDASVPALPIGISFFTFQALSYLIDLYFRRVSLQRNPMKLALYISFFPQLIAGPIVRYSEVEKEIQNRNTTRSDVSEGAQQFVRGLAKKTLLADPLGLVADQIFAIPDAGLSPETAWVGAICYALQLYFDFSAYSDMAIGLGRIFGFKFPKNFNYPYVSQSITEFWRRWHMTLSRWFRDYLYIPLGGNRYGPMRTYLNLSIVFLATGIWHGAAWTFIAWGAFHGLFLILERIGLDRLLSRCPNVLRHMYLLIVVLCGWVMFRAETFEQTLSFYGAMFLGQRGAEAAFFPLARYVDAYIYCILALAMIVSVGLRPWLNEKFANHVPFLTGHFVSAMWFLALFALAIISVGAASYSPFIYFRF